MSIQYTYLHKKYYKILILAIIVSLIPTETLSLPTTLKTLVGI